MKSKTKKKWFAALGILISVFLIAVISLAWLYGSSSAIDKHKYEVDVPAFSVTVKTQDGNITVNSWENIKDNKTYIFLPAGAKLDNFTVHCDGAQSLEINGESAELDSQTKLINSGGEYEIKLDGKKYDTVILHGANIPSVHINTENQALSSIYADKSHKEKAEIEIYSKGKKIVNDSLKYIKGRGNASWEKPQKSFNIKFKKKINLFDMGKAKKYSLISPYADQTLIKNYLTYMLADNVGLEYTSDSTLVDLYVDNNYLGAYLLADSVEAGKKRVNINDLDDENELANPDINIDELDVVTSAESIDRADSGTQRWVDIQNEPEDITNGYIIQLEFAERYLNESSGFVTDNGQPIVLASPEYATKGEIEYISSFYQDFENALYADDGYNNLGKHYSEYIDINSFAKMYIVQELGKNKDANETSTYMFLDDGGILKAGPVWDFDNAFGNQVFLGNMNDTQHLKADELQVCYKGFFRALYKHSDFRTAVCNEWENMRDEVLGFIEMADECDALISDSAVMNGIRWNRYNTVDIEENKEKYAQAISDLKDFINTRINLFDSTFSNNSSVLFYYPNGGNGNYQYGESKNVGDRIIVSDNMYESDRKFLGWNTQPDGSGNSYNPNDEITLDSESVTLYAQWSDGKNAVLTVKNKINSFYKKVYNSLKYRICEVTG
ncbi:MAG: CotH kinase family protein [Eubacterium sp.]|nr:CotH kinase family protein [Eubacterium sp.]